MFVKAFSGPSLRRAVCNGMKSLSSDAGAAAGTDAENRIKVCMWFHLYNL